MAKQFSRLRKIAAWSVHLFTATGLIMALFALNAIIRRQWREMVVFLVIAVLIDSVDGTLSRKVRVKEVAPAMDGALLDNITDYIIWTFLPAIAIIGGDFVPKPASWPIACLIVLSSAFQFCQTGAKAADPSGLHYYYKGFPSGWVVLLFYMIIAKIDPRINLAIFSVCVVLVFVPIKFIYPARTKMWFLPTLIFSAIWGLTTLYVLAFAFNRPPGWYFAWVIFYFSYYLLASIVLTVKIGFRREVESL